MSSYRLALAFFYHESHSFSPLRTGLQAFRQEALFVGEDVVRAYRGTRTELGGFLDALDGTEFKPVPVMAAAACPAGPVTTEAYEQIRADMIDGLRRAGELDGLLLALHGAMVVDDYQDPETDLIRHIRDDRGADFPIAVTLDLHANVTGAFVEQKPLSFGFQTYPHVDAYEQGVRAAHALMRQIRGEAEYVQFFAKLPALLPSINMRTAEGPMGAVVDAAIEWEKQDGVVAASVFGGFPYSDIEGAGASIVVLATDAEQGERCCRELALRLWSLRQEFLQELPNPEAAVEAARQPEHRRPVVLVDVADNPLSGGGADTTALLREVLAAGIPRTLVGALCDPAVLQQASEAGEGAAISCALGGKVSPEFGDPIAVQAKVVRLSAGRFRNTGPMNTGLEVDTGGAAHLRIDGVDVVLTGQPITANDPELFGHLGIDVGSYDLVVLKAKNHFRAAFEPLVGDIVYVDAPGVASNDLTRFRFRNVSQQLWPFNRAATFDGDLTAVVIPGEVVAG